MENEKKIILIGTAHVSKKSVEEVEKAIENEKPSAVAVELDLKRYRVLKGERIDVNLADIIKKGNVFLFLFQLFLSKFQKKIGKETGVKPGEEMLKAAVEAKGDSNLKLLGVTILTSHSEKYINYIGSKYSLEELALKLAKTAVNTGIDGIVSSPFEVKKLKEQIGNFIAVTPGIRLTTSKTDDQTRIATPEFAVSQGADILVVGRPILKAEDRKKAIEEIINRMNNA